MVVMDESGFKLKKDYKYVQKVVHTQILYFECLQRFTCLFLHYVLTYKITQHHEKIKCARQLTLVFYWTLPNVMQVA
jgi:hypothetical protein